MDITKIIVKIILNIYNKQHTNQHHFYSKKNNKIFIEYIKHKHKINDHIHLNLIYIPNSIERVGLKTPS